MKNYGDDYDKEFDNLSNGTFNENVGYSQSSDGSLDSDVDSHEELEMMYDNMEKRERKIFQMKEEIAKIYKKKKVIVFNVYNVANSSDFDKKMKENFDYLEYKIKEEDVEENCLVIEVKMTMAEDFLNIDGCQINNHNIEIYMDVETKKKDINMRMITITKQKKKRKRRVDKKNQKIKRELQKSFLQADRIKN